MRCLTVLGSPFGCSDMSIRCCWGTWYSSPEFALCRQDVTLHVSWCAAHGMDDALLKNCPYTSLCVCVRWMDLLGTVSLISTKCRLWVEFLRVGIHSEGKRHKCSVYTHLWECSPSTIWEVGGSGIWVCGPALPCVGQLRSVEGRRLCLWEAQLAVAPFRCCCLQQQRLLPSLPPTLSTAVSDCV